MSSTNISEDWDSSPFFGIRVDRISTPVALGIVTEYLSTDTNRAPRKVYFANVHTIHLGQRMPDFRQTVNDGDLILPDGSGLILAGRVLSAPVVENINGTDFTPIVLREAQAKGWGVYLLGGTPDVVKTTNSRLKNSYPGLRIVGYRSGYFTLEEEEGIVDDINAAKPHILLVALGSPLQEMFIDRWSARLNVRVCFAVGGLFDFLSGSVKRAPGWMRKLGIEWLFRLLQDPGMKWRRTFIEMPTFIGMVVAARIFHKGRNDRRIRIEANGESR